MGVKWGLVGVQWGFSGVKWGLSGGLVNPKLSGRGIS